MFFRELLAVIYLLLVVDGWIQVFGVEGLGK
jgi:hypothetical protein